MSQVRIKLFQHISHPKNIPEAKNIPGQEAENNWIKDLKEPSSNQCISGNLCNSYLILQFSSVQLSSVTQLCPTLRNPMNLRMPGLPCPSPTPGVHPNSCPLSQWCHPITSSSVIPFSSCSQSFPAPGSFQMSSSSHQLAKVLEFQLKHQSFQWTSRTDLL